MKRLLLPLILLSLLASAAMAQQAAVREIRIYDDIDFSSLGDSTTGALETQQHTDVFDGNYQDVGDWKEQYRLTGGWTNPLIIGSQITALNPDNAVIGSATDSFLDSMYNYYSVDLTEWDGNGATENLVFWSFAGIAEIRFNLQGSTTSHTYTITTEYHEGDGFNSNAVAGGALNEVNDELAGVREVTITGNQPQTHYYALVMRIENRDQAIKGAEVRFCVYDESLNQVDCQVVSVVQDDDGVETTPTSTPTLAPTDTPTATSTNTPIPVEITVTPTPTPTETFTPTNTPVPPTNTPTNTPTLTFTPTLTSTPTLTPTETFTPTWTPTNTPVPATGGFDLAALQSHSSKGIYVIGEIMSVTSIIGNIGDNVYSGTAEWESNLRTYPGLALVQNVTPSGLVGDLAAGETLTAGFTIDTATLAGFYTYVTSIDQITGDVDLSNGSLQSIQILVASPTPTPTNTPTPTATPTPTQTFTPTNTPTATNTPVLTWTPTPISTPDNRYVYDSMKVQDPFEHYQLWVRGQWPLPDTANPGGIINVPEQGESIPYWGSNPTTWDRLITENYLVNNATLNITVGDDDTLRYSGDANVNETTAPISLHLVPDRYPFFTSSRTWLEFIDSDRYNPIWSAYGGITMRTDHAGAFSGVRPFKVMESTATILEASSGGIRTVPVSANVSSATINDVSSVYDDHNLEQVLAYLGSNVGTGTGTSSSTAWSAISDPTDDLSLNMGNTQTTFNFTNSAASWRFNVSGGFTNDVLRIDQDTGNPGAGTSLLRLEAQDPDVILGSFLYDGDNSGEDMLRFQMDRATPTNGDYFFWDYYFDNSAGTATQFLHQDFVARDVTAGAEEGIFRYDVITGGVVTEKAAIAGHGMSVTGTIEGTAVETTTIADGSSQLPTENAVYDWVTGLGYLPLDGLIAGSNITLVTSAINGTAEISSTASGGASTLSDLTDTTITSPATDEFLKYNGSTWVNSSAPAGGSGGIADITAGDGISVTTIGGATRISAVPYEPAKPYYLAGAVTGHPATSVIMIALPFIESVSFPANFTSSTIMATVAPSVTAEFSLQKNSIEFGTASFPQNVTVAEISSSSISFATDDIFRIVSPNFEDINLKDFLFNMKGWYE